MRASVNEGSWLAATPPTVAIEIASRRVTVVGLASSGPGTHVASVAMDPLPNGAVVPQLSGINVVHPEAVTAALSRALQRAGLGGTRRAALVVPDSIARVSLVPLTSIPARPLELDQVLKWQLRKATPFPLDQAQVTYFPASRTAEATTFAAVVARRDVVAEYERVATAAGLHAGTVDLAGFNVMNVVMAGEDAGGDALLVHVAAEATTLAILRNSDLMFYRHRTALDDEPLGALVHQTAMYYEDRLGGSRFARVWVSGANAEDRREIGARLGVDAHTIDARSVGGLPADPPMTTEILDAVAAPVGILIRNRKAA